MSEQLIDRMLEQSQQLVKEADQIQQLHDALFHYAMSCSCDIGKCVAEETQTDGTSCGMVARLALEGKYNG